MQLSRTHLAILISLIGTGSVACRQAVAQDETFPRESTMARVESSESAIRLALGLAAPTSAASDGLETRKSKSSVTSPKTVLPQWDAGALGLASSVTRESGAAPHHDAVVRPPEDSTDETRVRWTLAILPPPIEPIEPVPAPRGAAPLGANARTNASSHTAAHPALARTDERPTVDQPALERPTSEPPVFEAAVLADRAQPSQVVSPLPDVDEIDGLAASLLSTPGPAPRPRRRGDHPQNAVIADPPSSKSRRGNPWVATTLTLPPERATTHRAAFGATPHARPPRPRYVVRTQTDAASKDPLVSLLQVLDDRKAGAEDREPLVATVATASNANGTRIASEIASDVFERIAFEVERLATAPSKASLVEEPLVVPDIVDTVAASEAPAEPVVIIARADTRSVDDAGVGERVGGGRFLPMNLLDVLDGEVIDPAGALPVQALLVRSPIPPVDARPIHELLPLATTLAGSRADTASIAALRSFFDDRSAMRNKTRQESSGEHRSTAPIVTTTDARDEAHDAMAFETLDFPPLFDEAPAFAKLQVQADVERIPAVAELLTFVLKPASAPGPDLRPSASFDIFDPKLDLLATSTERAEPPAATPSAPLEFEIKSIVRGRRDPAAEASVEPRPDPLHGALVALDDSKLEEMRGGFETDSGLRISFGIERAVYVNGNLVTTTSLNVADLSRLTAGQAQSMGIDRATLGIIQSGAKNTFTPSQLNAGSVTTVVQNTLNDQKIQGITQINATVNSLDVIRRSDVQSRIQSALTDSIRR